MSAQFNVGDYVIQRLAKEGISDCFGVAGDYVFRMCDAVVRSKSVKWIGCSNELDAAYAADGYARVRGCSMLMTTYAVGELSALNGVMGARAERSCVFHIVGMQTMRQQRVHKITHHTLGDGVFQNFANISAQAACVSAVITPDNCVGEMERIIATARAESQPAYILVASDYAVVPVTPCDTPAWPKPASGPELDGAIAALAERVERANSLVILPAYTVGRFRLQKKLQALIEKLGCPFATMTMDKGILNESHPQFAGMYSGAASSPEVLRAVEAADLVIDAGGVCFHDINTSAYSHKIAPEKFVTIGIDHVRVGDRVFNPVQMGEVFDRLTAAIHKNFGYRAPRKPAFEKRGGDANDPITAAALYPPVSGIPTTQRSHHYYRKWHVHFRSRAASPARRRGDSLSDPLGFNRLGNGCDLGGRPRGPLASHSALHRRRLPSTHSARRGHDGAQQAQARDFCAQ
jgi:indolepyruvate decarboxylase